MLRTVKTIRKLLVAAGILVFGAPLPAFAQSAPKGWVPVVTDEFQQARETARASVLSNLTPDHRAKTQAILNQFNRGAISMPDAARAIDGVLSQAECKAVMDQEQQFSDTMQQTFIELNPGGPPPPAETFAGDHAQVHPDPGRFLLMVTASPGALQGDPPSH
jgi:hypothetical protein